MKQGSRARHNPDSQRHGGSSGPPSAGDLASAVALAAEKGSCAPDPAALGLATLDREDPPRAGRTEHPPRPHLEDDFFARGEEIGSVPPSFVDAIEGSDEAVRRTIPPAVLARRARMRRIVGSAVGCAAVLTALVVAKALWATRAAPPPPEGALSVRNVIVPSIAMTAQEPAPAPATEPPSNPVAPAPAADEPSTTEEIRPPVLPAINHELPAPSDVATERAWEAAAEHLSAPHFTAADKAFPELGRRAATRTRHA